MTGKDPSCYTGGQGTGDGGPEYPWDTLLTLYWLPENRQNRQSWLKVCPCRVRGHGLEQPRCGCTKVPNGGSVGKDPALDSQGANKAGLSSVPPEPGTQQEVGPQARDCPSNEGRHLGMVISSFPARSISLFFFFLKRKKSF